jgi:putative RNA 2'-phosphotransferase
MIQEEKDLIRKGKQLSFLLRHDTEYSFDEHGYREVQDLVQNHGFTNDEIVELVETNDKQRYEFNDDKSKIRARQGHSVNVNVDLKETLPPDVLFHGTATRFLDSIREKGILKMSRNYVQLSEKIDTAMEVGGRHGNPVVLGVDTKTMREDGIKFYLSNNNVWLTEFVDSKYILAILGNNKK